MASGESTNFDPLKKGGIAMVVLAAIVLMGLAVITGFKDTLLIDNDTADAFVTALAIFGTFAGILVLAIMGKSVIGMFKKV